MEKPMTERREQTGEHNAPTPPAGSGAAAEPLVAGRYRLGRELGRGGFATVYEAEDAVAGRRVVVKALHRLDEETRRKFRDEQQALLRLSREPHPGLCAIRDVGELPDGRPYLATDYVEGESLAERLRRGPLPLPEAARIVAQVGAALAAAHAQGVIHRDVKPDNLLLTADADGEQRAVLIDFGIAHVGEAGERGGTTRYFGGTLRYAAPEQVEARREITAACDVYGLAATAYELLTGRSPFELNDDRSLSSGALLTERKRGPARPASAYRSELSAAVDRLLLQGLRYAPEERPAAADYGRALGEAIAACAAGSKTRPAPPEPGDPTRRASASGDDATWKDFQLYRGAPPWETPEDAARRPQKRSARLVAAAAAAALLIGGAWGLRYWTADRTPPPAPEKAPGAPPEQLGYALLCAGAPDGLCREPYEFWTGSVFRLRLTPRREGYLWVFDEGLDARGRRRLFALFPQAAPRGGPPPPAPAGKPVESGAIEWVGRPGEERLYFVWTARAEAAVVAAWRGALRNGGVVPERAAGPLRAFLERYAAADDVQVERRAEETVLRGPARDALVHVARVTHRR